MQLSFAALIILFLFFVLALEGMGIQFGREVTLFLIILMPPVFFIHMLFHKKKIVYPKKASILYFTFIILSMISAAFGVNVQKSIQYSLYLISLFLVFLISFNLRTQLEKPLTILIFLLSFIFTLYFLLLNFHVLNFFVATTGYQFVFSKFGSHNHLGDFLVIPGIICIYYLYTRKQMLLSLCFLLFAFFFIFFSYSRSAYLSLAFASLFIHINFLIKKHSWTYILVSRLLILGLVLSAIFYLVTVSRQAKSQPLSAVFYNFLVQNEGLDKNKDITGGRIIYLNQAFSSIQKSPLLGIGSNNFVLISNLYAKYPNQNTESAHNIFLEILVGQGVLGLIPFLGLVILILIKSRKNALYFAFLAMLINFQTDYTYQIYSFLLLFFVIAGVISSEKKSGIQSLVN